MALPHALHQAFEQKDVAEMLSLLEQLPLDMLQPFADSYLPQIAFEGYESVIKYLHQYEMVLEARDDTGATTLHYAVLGGHLALVQYLHEEGADIHARDKDGTTLLHAAAICGDLAIVKYFCEQGLEVNAVNVNGHTALHLVVVTGMLRERTEPTYIAKEEHKIIAYLQEQGADMEIADKAEQTARMLLTTWQEEQPSPMWLSKK